MIFDRQKEYKIREEKRKNNNDREAKLEMYFQLNTMVENAKRDLSTGISREQLKEFHDKHYFKSEQDYEEVKNAIEVLETIISLYSPMVEQLKKELDN